MVMQATSLILSAVLLASAASPLAAGDRGDDRRGDWRRPGRPNITIEPYIDLSRPPRTNPDDPEFVMNEIARCNAAGIRSFVDCLRPTQTALMIRRLEACVQSETIPDDPQRVAVCLPASPLR
jgi:hypothetical protein